MMKQKIITLLIFNILVVSSLFSQSIPNAGFENWSTKYTIPIPHEWYTHDTTEYISTGLFPIHRTSDSRSGKFSVKCTANGFQGISNGYRWNWVAYNSRPDSIAFSFKSDLRFGDSVWVELSFGFRNINLGITRIKIGGKHSNWTDTTIKIVYDTTSSIPDSIWFGAGIQLWGSDYFMIDDVKLIGNGKVGQFPDNSFEEWDSLSYEDPDKWQSDNVMSKIGLATSPITKSTDANTGSYALQINTTNFKVNTWYYLSYLFDTVGYIHIGKLDDNGKLKPGFQSTTRPKVLYFYYKYIPASKKDLGNAGIWIRKNGKTLDSTMVTLPAASNYTLYQLTLPNLPSNIPDTIDIAFASSNWYGSRHNWLFPTVTDLMSPGSILLVDDLAFDTTTGIASEVNGIQSLNIFPNPSTGSFYFQYYTNKDELADCSIRNILGQEVWSKKLNIVAQNNNPILIESNHLKLGIYTFQIRTGQETKMGKLVIE